MALEIPTYETESGVDVAPAYVAMTMVMFDLNRGMGRVQLTIHPTQAKAGRTPLGTISVALGETFAPGQVMPTMQQLLADPQFLASWRVVVAKLYAGMAGHPTLAGAVSRPPNTR